MSDVKKTTSDIVFLFRHIAFCIAIRERFYYEFAKILVKSGHIHCFCMKKCGHGWHAHTFLIFSFIPSCPLRPQVLPYSFSSDFFFPKSGSTFINAETTTVTRHKTIVNIKNDLYPRLI